MANPFLKESTFRKEGLATTGETMTVAGTANKSFVLLALCTLAAGFTWDLLRGLTPDRLNSAMGIMMVALIGGFVIGLVTVFKKDWAAVTAPLYSLCEGVLLGAISMVFEHAYPGIVLQAVLCTFGVFFLMLTAYRFRWIQVTERFRLGVVVATGTIALVYFVEIILNLFHVAIPYIHQAGPVGIIFSLIVIGIASMNLILDFDMIEGGAAAGAPKYMEWYASWGLMVTIIWLYMEILRLLANTRRR